MTNKANYDQMYYIPIVHVDNTNIVKHMNFCPKIYFQLLINIKVQQAISQFKEESGHFFPKPNFYTENAEWTDS